MAVKCDQRMSWIAAIVMTGAFVGCGAERLGPEVEEPLGPLESLPRELSPVEQSLVASANAFGLELFKELAGVATGENVIASPLSAFMALSMTANGANGTTLDAMRNVLHHSGHDEPEVNAACKSLIELLRGLDADVDFSIANSIWHEDDFPIVEAFADISREYFDALVGALDFEDPAAPATINQWVEESTNGRITELIQEIRPDEVLFLINAIYFQGAWERPFDPDLTQEAPFNLSNGTTVQTSLMSREDHFLYQENELFQGVDLRYGRSAFSMTVLLPAAGRTLDDLVTPLDEARWDSWMNGFASQHILLQLPRFTLEWEKQLKEALTALGMGIAFDWPAADFSRLAERELYLTRAWQKTLVEVDEEGTEAAAATSVAGAPGFPRSIRVDRPFVFAIRERFSGTILFLGVVENPV